LVFMHPQSFIFSASVIVYTASLTVAAVFIRREKSVYNQYAWSVTILCFVAALFGYGAGSVLFLAVAPPLVNYVRTQLK
jgi:hypothetical protein